MTKRFVSILVYLLAIISFNHLTIHDAVGQNASTPQQLDINSPRYQQLFTELVEKYHFNRSSLQQLFANTPVNKRVLELMDKQWGAPLPWYQYEPRFITPSIIRQGKIYLQKYRPLFDRIEREFGVDREAIVAIWAIETRFGGNTGGFKLFDTLNTLFAAYPRRSDFFRQELIDFLLLCRQNHINPRTVEGSYAGAFGQAQFMPSSYNKYAVDYDGDGNINLLDSRPDVLSSIANYLRHYGWNLHQPTFVEIGHHLKSTRLIATEKQSWRGRISWMAVAQDQNIKLPRPVGNNQLTIAGLELDPKKGGGKRYIAGYPNFQAIQHYNHSQKYATAVSTLAKAFKNK